MAEDQVLVELDAALAVEVDVEQLALPQRLGDAGGEVQPGHLLVADLGVHADHVAVLELGDERQRVPDGRQQDVAARLVRLRLDGEADAVALLDDVRGERCRCPRGSGPGRPGRPWRRRTPSPRGRPRRRRSARRARRPGRCCAATLRSANRRTERSLLVKPPSLNTGWVNRFVVIIGICRPVSASASLNRAMIFSRSESDEPNGIRSSSWKVRPHAPSSVSRCTASTGSRTGRVASPNGSRPCQPTVQRPKLNLSSRVGVSVTASSDNDLFAC